MAVLVPPTNARPSRAWVEARRKEANDQSGADAFSPMEALLDRWTLISSETQAWALQNGGRGFAGVCLHTLKLIDLAWYSKDRQGWTRRHKMLLGDSFCGMGKLNLNSYDDVARILSNEQHRGPHIGRATFDSSRFSPLTPLFLSNVPDAAPEQYAQRLKVSVFLETIFSSRATLARTRDETTTSRVVELARQLQAAAAQSPRVPMTFNGTLTVPFSSEAIRPFVVWYMHYVLLGLDLSQHPALREAAETVLIDYGSGGSMFAATRMAGIPGSFSRYCLPNIGAPLEARLLEAYEKALLETNKQAVLAVGSARLAAETLQGIVAIAAVLGGTNLLAAALVHLPMAAELAASSAAGDEAPLTSYVLESGRLYGPVNQINVILDEALSRTIGTGERAATRTFPPGTLVAASILGASFDPRRFAEPAVFDPRRVNLRSSSLNFAAVGIADGKTAPATDATGCPFARDPARSTERACPGRFMALEMVKAVIRAYHGFEPASPTVPLLVPPRHAATPLRAV